MSITLASPGISKKNPLVRQYIENFKTDHENFKKWNERFTCSEKEYKGYLKNDDEINGKIQVKFAGLNTLYEECSEEIGKDSSTLLCFNTDASTPFLVEETDKYSDTVKIIKSTCGIENYSVQPLMKRSAGVYVTRGTNLPMTDVNGFFKPGSCTHIPQDNKPHLAFLSNKAKIWGPTDQNALAQGSIQRFLSEDSNEFKPNSKYIDMVLKDTMINRVHYLEEAWQDLIMKLLNYEEDNLHKYSKIIVFTNPYGHFEEPWMKTEIDLLQHLAIKTMVDVKPLTQDWEIKIIVIADNEGYSAPGLYQPSPRKMNSDLNKFVSILFFLIYFINDKCKTFFLNFQNIFRNKCFFFQFSDQGKTCFI